MSRSPVLYYVKAEDCVGCVSHWADLAAQDVVDCGPHYTCVRSECAHCWRHLARARTDDYRLCFSRLTGCSQVDVVITAQAQLYKSEISVHATSVSLIVIQRIADVRSSPGCGTVFNATTLHLLAGRSQPSLAFS